MPTARDVSHVRIPPNMQWSKTETDRCPWCGRETPRPYAQIGRKLVRFYPYPCDCEGARKWQREGVYVEPKPRIVPERLSACDESLASQVAELSSMGVGAYLWGGVGTGKTAAAYRAAEIASQRGTWAVVTPSKIETAVSDAMGSRDEAFGRYERCRFLVLDDLGNGEGKQAANAVLRIVNARYEAGLPVVVTSNYRLGELGERYASQVGAVAAQSMVSRLAAMTQRIEVGGTDRRIA